MRSLELFCGTKSFSNIAKEFYNTCTLDLNANCNPDICVDILNWDYSKIPQNHYRIIWASPPCTEFSLAKTIGKRDLKLASKIVRRTLKIIEYFKPKYFVIENPVGLLRNMNYMKKYKKFLTTVSYCKYGYKYRKNTDLWTNIKYQPKECKPGSYCNYKAKHGKHEYSVSNQTHKYDSNNIRIEQNYLKKTSDRYKMPPRLIQTLLEHAI